MEGTETVYPNSEDNIDITKKDYKSIVKKYLNNDEINKEYYDMIENNPDKIFINLNEKLFSIWQSIIYILDPTIIESDAIIIAHIPDRKDQKIIINDAKRTRVRESKFMPGFQKILEMVLTFYCDTKKIHYKQGLNEIFGALILMQYKIKGLKLLNIFNFGEAFIDRLLPNYYYETGIYSLKSSQSLFVLLLKYHEPSVFNYLDSSDIPHEMYATNWLLTLRSSKLNLDVLYSFWDFLIKIKDPLFIHFVLAAFIIYHRELLINCDSNLLIKLMTGLTINSVQEMNGIIKIALELRKSTPYSFRLLANKLGFLKTNNQDMENIYEKYKPEQILTLPIYPTEILYENNKNNIEIKNEEQYQKILQDLLKEGEPKLYAVEKNKNIGETNDKENKKLGEQLHNEGDSDKLINNDLINKGKGNNEENNKENINENNLVNNKSGSGNKPLELTGEEEDTIKKEYEKVQKDLEEMKDKYNKLENENKELKSKYQELSDENTNLKKDNEKQKNQILEKEKEEKRKKEEYDKKISENNSLQQKIKILEKENEEMKNKIKVYEKEKMHNDNRIKNLEENEENLNKEISDLKIKETKYIEIIKNNKKEKKSTCNTIHNGIKCEKCFKEPIIGYRYKCIQCDNYNLCQDCEEKNAINEDHPH